MTSKFSVRKIISISLVLVTTFGSVSLVHAESPNGSPTDQCTDVRIFALRGSTETGNFGGLLDSVISTLKKIENTSRISIRGIPAEEYPASLVGASANIKGQRIATSWVGFFDAHTWTIHATALYVSSKNVGYSSLYNEIISWKLKCPESNLILLGYSQGAHIVGDISQTIIRGGMPGIPPINLIGSVLFGDPAFNPTSLGSAGDYSNNAHGLMGQRDPYSTLLQGKILSWCNHEDLICQGSGLLNFALQTVKNCATIAALGCDIIGQINSHLNYPTAQWGGISEVAFTAQWLARQIAKAPNPYTSSSGGNTGTSGNTGWSETTGSVAHTWTNYLNAGGFEGPTISSNRTVVVACKVNGFRVSNGNTTWYRIAQFPWSNHYFVSADAFYNNGATSGSLHGTPPFDPTIVDC